MDEPQAPLAPRLDAAVAAATGNAVRTQWTLRLLRIVPAAWLGLMLAVGTIATPVAFAVLGRADAARVVADVLAREARWSLAMGIATVLLARGWLRHAGGDAPQSPAAVAARPVVWLALAAIATVVVGYYALQAPMQAARAGTSMLTFGQWHAISLALYGARMLLAAAIAWRMGRAHAM